MCGSKMHVALCCCCCLLLCQLGGANGVHSIRGDQRQWLGKSKRGPSATTSMRPDDEHAGDVLARAFERGEGGPTVGMVGHGGRADHTETLDLEDYTQKKRHKERMSAVPKGFHMPSERKADGVRNTRNICYAHAFACVRHSLAQNPASTFSRPTVAMVCAEQTYYNEKWAPGLEAALRTRLKNSGVATGGRTQQALRHEVAALEMLADNHDPGQPRVGSRTNAGFGQSVSLERKFGSGTGRSEEREALASMVAKAAAPSHVATKADIRNMNKARLDDGA